MVRTGSCLSAEERAAGARGKGVFPCALRLCNLGVMGLDP